MTKKTSRLITDHAFVRYAERVLGLDVDGMKTYMLSPEIIAAIRGGASGIQKDGFTYVIDGGKVVTVVRGKYVRRNK